MQIGGGVVFGAPRATSIVFSRRIPTLRSFSSLCSSPSSFTEHISFMKEVAATEPPRHLPHLLRLLKTRGDAIISPEAKQGLIPLVVPLAKNSSDAVIALLRWPTAPLGMEMPVVEVHKHGVWLLAKTVDQFIHRILVEEDAKKPTEGNDNLFHAATDAGQNLYTKGDFAKSQISDLEVYLLKKVGLFPDVLERKVMRHFEKGDHVSALVTGEFYTKKEHFPGFARPFVFNAEVLLKFVEFFLSLLQNVIVKNLVSIFFALAFYVSSIAFYRVGRKLEAKDAARGALKSPWWTLGCRYQV
ncbi:protein IN CHLOROPLAST ATPASE BIOGENESIS, chloroplastic isoform X3 [Hevea brasiliensis]|uniref:protein IN CHLOROPLAST ATPASE BIOGENESIS, chloroplastic isoform X3 n=1 Tax=Hevea brasiliensis TaxID=3981 RepID=UPI0025E863A3|nr:protein IN CHLOROPLAST ATPASE BIOGENESIS, chloroplastic isoform X3 [Hevea brasiliensis]